MAEIVLAGAALLATVIGTAVDNTNRAADIVEQRKQFTQECVRGLSEKKRNAVIVAGGYRAKGFENKTTHDFHGIQYTLFEAPRNQVMIVENRGDGGYENWALSGTNWVRWGKIVKFHPYWNRATMGEPYETRDSAHFVGWDY